MSEQRMIDDAELTHIAAGHMIFAPAPGVDPDDKHLVRAGSGGGVGNVDGDESSNPQGGDNQFSRA